MGMCQASSPTDSILFFPSWESRALLKSDRSPSLVSHATVVGKNKPLVTLNGEEASFSSATLRARRAQIMLSTLENLIWVNA